MPERGDNDCPPVILNNKKLTAFVGEVEVLMPPMTLYQVVRVDVNNGGVFWWSDHPLTTITLRVRQYTLMLDPISLVSLP